MVACRGLCCTLHHQREGLKTVESRDETTSATLTSRKCEESSPCFRSLPGNLIFFLLFSIAVQNSVSEECIDRRPKGKKEVVLQG